GSLPAPVFIRASSHARVPRVFANAASRSDVEAEVQDIAFLHDVFLAFQPQPARVACAGFALVLDEVVVADGFSSNEAFLEIGVDHGGGLRSGGAFLHRPGAHFLHAGGEVGLQAEQGIGGADDAIQAGFFQAHVGQEHVAVGVIQL